MPSASPHRRDGGLQTVLDGGLVAPQAAPTWPADEFTAVAPISRRLALAGELPRGPAGAGQQRGHRCPCTSLVRHAQDGCRPGWRPARAGVGDEQALVQVLEQGEGLRPALARPGPARRSGGQQARSGVRRHRAASITSSGPNRAPARRSVGRRTSASARPHFASVSLSTTKAKAWGGRRRTSTQAAGVQRAVVWPVSAPCRRSGEAFVAPQNTSQCPCGNRPACHSQRSARCAPFRSPGRATPSTPAAAAAQIRARQHGRAPPASDAPPAGSPAAVQGASGCWRRASRVSSTSGANIGHAPPLPALGPTAHSSRAERRRAPRCRRRARRLNCTVALGGWSTREQRSNATAGRR